MADRLRSVPGRVGHLAVLYLVYLRLYLHALAEHRVDTLIALLSGLAAQASGFLFLSVLFRRLPSLATWSYYEVVFFYGYATTVMALVTTFGNAPFMVRGYVRGGRLDGLLLRPVGSLFQLVGLAQQPNSISAAATGVALIGYAAANLRLGWTPAAAVLLAVGLVSATVIRFCILMLVATLSFWVEVRSLVYPVAWLYDFTRYPLDVFTPLVRAVLTFVVPYALASYYPAALVLRPAAYAWASWTVPAFAIAMLLVVRVTWTVALRHYESTGGAGGSVQVG